MDPQAVGIRAALDALGVHVNADTLVRFLVALHAFAGFLAVQGYVGGGERDESGEEEGDFHFFWVVIVVLGRVDGFDVVGSEEERRNVECSCCCSGLGREVVWREV